MQFNWYILRSMLYCPYKAWQLIKENNGKNEDISLPNKLTSQDKIAFAAWQYSVMLLAGKSIQIAERAKRLFESVKEMLNKGEPPSFHKNSHCLDCKFWVSCHQKLKERDCISLLGGMPAKTIAKYHSKGIFTVLQLSHLFRLRRKRNRPQTSGNYLWELKALAMREKKTFVLQTPDIIESVVSIYLDFEGLPEDDFIYLIGAIVKEEGKEYQCFSFWANDKKREDTIFSRLFDLLRLYPDATIFHYGSYETKELKKWKKLCRENFLVIEKRMINLLSYFRTHVYPPTYTNGLKEIGGFLGFQWNEKEVTGLQSIEWRKNWEATAGEKWKAWLIQYNLDDCNALIKVHEWFKQLSINGERDDVQQVSKMKKYTPYRLQNNTEYSEDFQCINKAAYFDYQHSKIYWRNRNLVAKKRKKAIHFGKGQMVWQPKKVNEVIQMPVLEICPHCGHKKVYHSSKQRTFLQTDLKFTRKGIKQWVIEYRSSGGKCARCAKKYYDSVLKQVRYGNNVFAWSINLYVNYRNSFLMVSRLLEEQFGVWTNPTYFNDRNYQWWQRFKPEVDYCWQIILNSPVIHIDETTVRLTRGDDKGYVWVFATPHTVYYHLTLTREVSFLQEWLKDYKGVVVTDFFPGYESVSVIRQKCLIHLIRDLNDDLFKNPFDEEYKLMVAAFGQLLRKIVVTIDRYGLKKFYLKKHIKDTDQFYKKFVVAEQKGVLSIKYAKRLKKHWNELWTFLNYDGVPWNNNNAEVAIKAFAQHRRTVNGQVSNKGLKEYLSMLTIAQTCRYRDLSFLSFLRYKSGIWENVPAEALPGYLPFQQAKVFVHRLRLQDRGEWEVWVSEGKNPGFIPLDPVRVYEGGWKGWEDWLK